MKISTTLPAGPKLAGRDDDHPFSSLQRRMNSLFDDFFTGFDIAPRSLAASGFGAFAPSIDVKEGENDFIIRAELPGVEEKDIEINIAGDAVTIKGEKKEAKEDKGENYYYMERSYGSFNRVIPIASEMDADKAWAIFKNGVLSITIPKKQSVETKGIRIPIKAS